MRAPCTKTSTLSSSLLTPSISFTAAGYLRHSLGPRYRLLHTPIYTKATRIASYTRLFRTNSASSAKQSGALPGGPPLWGSRAKCDPLNAAGITTAGIRSGDYIESAFFSRQFSTVTTTPESGSATDLTADVADEKGSVRGTPPKWRPMAIQLGTRENKVCRILNNVAREYESKTGKRIELRIAGGWVRDKLLGLSCTDIDIGVDSMIGYDFAQLVAKYMESNGHSQRMITRISVNPAKGKHLETATMGMLGVPIDFANLRSETYVDPDRFSNEIVFGSPEEDAHHRDFTINALFYNIRTKSVEDYTGRGLKDLRDGIIRTPLRAYETFWQDPLRVLRCIRFAAKFQFQIAEDVRNAILDPRIREALGTKISKERIGNEIEKMLDGGGPSRSTAVRLLRELDLYDLVFPVPEPSILVKGISAVRGERRDVEDAYKLMWIMECILRINSTVASEDNFDHTAFSPKKDVIQELLLERIRGLGTTSHLCPMVKTEPPENIPLIAPRKEETRPERLKRNMFMASLLYPYRDMIATVNGKDVYVPTWINKNNLRPRSIQVQHVAKILRCIDEVQETVRSISMDIPSDEEQRSKEWATIGMMIRDIGFVPYAARTWPCRILMALGVELLPKYEQLKQGILDEEAKGAIAKYNSFLAKAESYGVEHCCEWRPLFEATELASILGNRLSPTVQYDLEEVMRWQLLHPELSKGHCRQWILNNRRRFSYSPYTAY
ncbi:hypothetical protein BC939DRAFT_488857 [Gamsiella multidivaricata]|uniref:uncharacterized protein n=1 Tax=Gamsiella multidivaricata TaxID=101098 RepID=UPI00221E5D8C|nr:uncharacterized protein BC939DRAFT_488857 [Gamsiella multidivaricata]KAI7832364.1 hypothetical protein BC939DRAFT_488857 [Gamsiella multidivaricata]